MTERLLLSGLQQFYVSSFSSLDNGKFFVRDVSGGRRLCAMWITSPQSVSTFLACVAAEIGGGDAVNAIENAVKKAM